jgi:hypothetical protein
VTAPLQVAAVGATAKGLFELENTAAYNLTVDHVFGLPHGEAGEAQKRVVDSAGILSRNLVPTFP